MPATKPDLPGRYLGAVAAGSLPTAAARAGAARIAKIAVGVFSQVRPDSAQLIDNTCFPADLDGALSIDTCATGAHARFI
jgi:hypothetical protein